MSTMSANGTLIKKQTYTTRQPDGTIVTTTTTTETAPGDNEVIVMSNGAPMKYFEERYEDDDIFFQFGLAPLNIEYCVTPPAFLRWLEIIICFIIVGCVSAVYGTGPYIGILGGHTFVLILACVCLCVTFILLLVLFLRLHRTHLQVVPWRMLGLGLPPGELLKDLVYSIIAALLFFIAGMLEAYYANGAWRGCGPHTPARDCDTIWEWAVASSSRTRYQRTGSSSGGMYRSGGSMTGAGRTSGASSSYRPSAGLSGGSYSSSSSRPSLKTGASFDSGGGYRSSTAAAATRPSYTPLSTYSGASGANAGSTAYSAAAASAAGRSANSMNSYSRTGSGGSSGLTKSYDSYSRTRRDTSVSRSDSKDSIGASRVADYDNLSASKRYEKTLDSYASSVLKQSHDRISARASAAAAAATNTSAAGRSSSRESSVTRTTSTSYMPTANGIGAMSSGARHSYAGAGRTNSGASYGGVTPTNSAYRSRSGSRQNSVSRSGSGAYVNGYVNDMPLGYGRSPSGNRYSGWASGSDLALPSKNSRDSISSDLSASGDAEQQRSSTATPVDDTCADTLTKTGAERKQVKRTGSGGRREHKDQSTVSAAAVSAALAPLAHHRHEQDHQDQEHWSPSSDSSHTWEELGDDDAQIVEDTLSEEERKNSPKLTPIKEAVPSSGDTKSAAADHMAAKVSSTRKAAGGRPGELLARLTQNTAASAAKQRGASNAAGAEEPVAAADCSRAQADKKKKKRVQRQASTKSNSSSSSSSSAKAGSPKKRRSPPKTTRASVNAPKSALIEVSDDYESIYGLSKHVADIDATVICVQDHQEGFADGSIPVMQRIRQRTKPVPVAGSAQAIMNINLERPHQRRHVARALPEKVTVRKRTKPVKAATDESVHIGAEFANPLPSGRVNCTWRDSVLVKKRTKPVRAAGDEATSVYTEWRRSLAELDTVKVLAETPRWRIKAVPLAAAKDSRTAISAHYDMPSERSDAALTVDTVAMQKLSSGPIRAMSEVAISMQANLDRMEEYDAVRQSLLHRPQQRVRTHPVPAATNISTSTHAELHMDHMERDNDRADVLLPDRPRVRLRSKGVRAATEEYRRSEFCWSLPPAAHSKTAIVSTPSHQSMCATIGAPWSASRQLTSSFTQYAQQNRASINLPVKSHSRITSGASPRPCKMPRKNVKHHAKYQRSCKMPGKLANGLGLPPGPIQQLEDRHMHADIVVAVEEDADTCDICVSLPARCAVQRVLKVPGSNVTDCEIMLSGQSRQMSTQLSMALHASEAASAHHHAPLSGSSTVQRTPSSSGSCSSGAALPLPRAAVNRAVSFGSSSQSSGRLTGSYHLPATARSSRSQSTDEEALMQRLKRESPMRPPIGRPAPPQHSNSGSFDAASLPPAEPDDPPSLVYFRNKLQLMRNAKSMEKSSDSESSKSKSSSVSAAVSHEVLELLSVADGPDATAAAAQQLHDQQQSPMTGTPEMKHSVTSDNSAAANSLPLALLHSLDPPVVDLDFEPLTNEEVAQLTSVTEKTQRKRPTKHRRLPTISSVDSQITAYESAPDNGSESDEITAILAGPPLANGQAGLDAMAKSADSPTSFMTAASDFHGSLEDVRKGIAEQHSNGNLNGSMRQQNDPSKTFGKAFKTSFDNLIKWPSSSKFNPANRLGRGGGQQSSDSGSASGAKKSASSASLPGFFSGQHVISKIHVSNGNNHGSTDLPPTPPSMSSLSTSPQLKTVHSASQLGAKLSTSNGNGNGITRTQSNIEKCVKQIDRVLNRVRSFQPRVAKDQADKQDKLLNEKLAYLDRAYDSIVMDSNEVKRSSDAIMTTGQHNADSVHIQVTGATFERAHSSEVAKPQPQRSAALHLPQYEQQATVQHHAANYLSVEPANQRVPANAVPTNSHSHAAARAASEEQSRLDFTRTWLQGDIKPFYQPQQNRAQTIEAAQPFMSAAVPPSAEDFERARQVVNDDESIGSASAEVAAINSRHDERLSQQNVAVGKAAGKPASVASSQGLLSPRKHQAVIMPSPIQYGHMQATKQTNNGGQIEQRLQQAGFPSFSPTGSEQPHTNKPLPVQQVNYANRYLPRRHMEAIWQSPSAQHRPFVPSSRISVASDECTGGKFAARRPRQQQLQQHHASATPSAAGAASPAYSARADSWIYDTRTDQDYDNATHSRRRRHPVEQTHAPFMWRSAAEHNTQRQQQQEPPAAMTHSDPQDLVADLELNVDAEQGLSASRYKFPTANSGDADLGGYEGVVKLRQRQAAPTSHVPMARSYGPDFTRIGAVPQLHDHKSPQRARRQSQQPYDTLQQHQQQQQQAAQRQARRASDTTMGTQYAVVGATAPVKRCDREDKALDIDAIEQHARSPFEVINNEPIGSSKVNQLKQRFDESGKVQQQQPNKSKPDDDYEMAHTYDNSHRVQDQLNVHTVGLTAVSPSSISPGGSWGSKPVNVVQPMPAVQHQHRSTADEPNYETMPHQVAAAAAACGSDQLPDLPDTPPPPRPPHWHDSSQASYDNVNKQHGTPTGANRKSKFRNMFSKLKGGDHTPSHNTHQQSTSFWGGAQNRPSTSSHGSQTSVASFTKVPMTQNANGHGSYLQQQQVAGDAFGSGLNMAAGKKRGGFGSRLKQSLFGMKK